MSAGNVRRWQPAAAFASLGVAAIAAYWWANRHPSEVVVTVPERQGLMAVWVRDEFPDVVAVEGSVARLAIPDDGLLRAQQMDCMLHWVRMRYVDREGRAVGDARSLGTSKHSSFPGVLFWFYRGPLDEGPASALPREGAMRGWGLLP